MKIKILAVENMNSRRLVLYSCFFLGMILCVKGVYSLNQINDYYNRNSIKKFDLIKNESIIQLVDEKTGELEQEKKSSEEESYVLENEKEEPVTLLLLGLDKDETRSDVIMLLHFNPTVRKLNILSIQRDTRVMFKGRYLKINSLVGSGGEALVIQTVQRITGLPVHYFLTMDFKGFRKIIDTLGGVEFYVPFDMHDDDPVQDLHIHLSKGLQLLDGKKAEQFVRYRKGYVDADIGRIRAQHDFLKTLINQKLKFRYLSKIDEIFNLLKDYVNTNIKLEDIGYYMKYINNVQDIEINTHILPGEAVYTDNVWYYLHDPDETLKLIELWE